MMHKKVMGEQDQTEDILSNNSSGNHIKHTQSFVITSVCCVIVLREKDRKQHDTQTVSY